LNLSNVQNAIPLNTYVRLFNLSCFFIILLSTQCYSQYDLYKKAYRYIYKSKELADFRNEILDKENVIVKRIIVSDSVFKNNPYLFLCSILFKKNNNNGDCTKLIGTDRLRMYDSIKQEYSGYIYSEKVDIPFKDRSSKGKKAFTLSFSDVFKNTIVAEVHFKNGKILNGQSRKSILFYFVFYANGKIKNVFTSEIQNYHRK
jgi:hypothetical protein